MVRRHGHAKGGTGGIARHHEAAVSGRRNRDEIERGDVIVG